MLFDGRQAGVAQLQWCGKYGFPCKEMFDKYNFCLIGEISHHVSTQIQ
jgi:hypothetical protein